MDNFLTLQFILFYACLPCQTKDCKAYPVKITYSSFTSQLRDLRKGYNTQSVWCSSSTVENSNGDFNPYMTVEFSTSTRLVGVGIRAPPVKHKMFGFLSFRVFKWMRYLMYDGIRDGNVRNRQMKDFPGLTESDITSDKRMKHAFPYPVMTKKLRIFFKLGLGQDHTCLRIEFYKNCGTLKRNMCKNNKAGCEQNCHDTPGSFFCSCRRGFELWRNGLNCVSHNIYMYNTIYSTVIFEEAQAHCTRSGGFLTTIFSSHEYVFVKKKITKWTQYPYYIGMVDWDQDQSYNWWIDGSDVVFKIFDKHLNPGSVVYIKQNIWATEDKSDGQMFSCRITDEDSYLLSGFHDIKDFQITSSPVLKTRSAVMNFVFGTPRSRLGSRQYASVYANKKTLKYGLYWSPQTNTNKYLKVTLNTENRITGVMVVGFDCDKSIVKFYLTYRTVDETSSHKSKIFSVPPESKKLNLIRPSFKATQISLKITDDTVCNGYQWDLTGRFTGKGIISECYSRPCEHICIETPESYYCRCKKNYHLFIDGKSCLPDISPVEDSIYLAPDYYEFKNLFQSYVQKGAYYQFFPDRKDFTAATEHCAKQGGFLPSVHKISEHRFIYRQLLKHPQCSKWFLGLKGNYLMHTAWQDDSWVDFTLFARTVPDYSYQANVVFMDKNLHYKWDFAPVHQISACVICQYKHRDCDRPILKDRIRLIKWRYKPLTLSKRFNNLILNLENELSFYAISEKEGYVQADFLVESILYLFKCISNSGASETEPNKNVFNIEYSLDQFEDFSVIADKNGQPQIFSCGPQAFAVHSIRLAQPVTARFIRMSWKYEKRHYFSISIELFGCATRTSDVGLINPECGKNPSQYSPLPSLKSFRCFYKRCTSSRKICGDVNYYYVLGSGSCSTSGPCHNLPCNDGSVCLEKKQDYECHCPNTADANCNYNSSMHVMIQNSLVKIDDYVTVFFVLKDSDKTPKFYVNISQDFSCSPELQELKDSNKNTYYCAKIRHKVTYGGIFEVKAGRFVNGFLQLSNTAKFRVSFLDKITRECFGRTRITGAAESMQLAFGYEKGKDLQFISSGSGICINKSNFKITLYEWKVGFLKSSNPHQCFTDSDFDNIRIPAHLRGEHHLYVEKNNLRQGYFRICVSITASYFKTYFKLSCGYFKIQLRDLKVVIKPPEIYQAVEKDRPLTLDASESIDPNSGDSSGLVYRWYCEKPLKHSTCEEIIRSFHSSSTFDYKREDMLPLTGPVLNIPKGHLITNETYLITVEISKEGVVSRNQSVTIYSMSLDAPKLKLRCHHNCNESVSPGEILSLTVECENCESRNIYLIKFQWELSTKSFGNVPSSFWKSKTSTGNDRESVVILENAFNLSEFYTLQVVANSNNGLEGSFKYIFKTSKPPSGGQCSISPKSGKALITQFVVLCAGYFTFNMPLTYTVFSNGTERAPIEFGSGTLLYHGHEDTVTLTLAEGPAEMDYWQTLTVTVIDATGSSSSLPLTVQVTHPQESEDTSVEFFDTILNDLTSDYRSGKTPVENFIRQAKNVVTMLRRKQPDTLSSQISKERIIRREVLNDILDVEIDDDHTLYQMADILADITVPEDHMSTEMQTQTLSLSKKMLAHLGHIAEETPSIAKVVAERQSATLFSILQFPKEEKVRETKDGIPRPPTVSSDVSQRLKTTAEPVMDLFDKIGEAVMQSVKTVVEEPINIKTPQTALLVARRKPDVDKIEFVSDDKKDDVGGAFIFHTAKALANYRADPKPIDVQVLILQKNPLVWMPSASNINLPVMKVTLKRDGKPLTVNLVPTPIDIFVSANFSKVLQKEDIYPLNVTADYSTLVLGSDAIKVKVPRIYGKKQIVKIFPVNRSVTLQVYMGIKKSDITIENIIKHGFDWPIREAAVLTYQEHKQDPYLLFLPDDIFRRRRSGNYFIGVRVKPGQYLNDGNSGIVYVHVGIQSFSIECNYWLEERAIWISSGCIPGPFTTQTHLHCWCDHLTIFSGGIFIAPNTVDPIDDAKLFLTFFNNPVVVTLTAAVWIIYILLLLWAEKADNKDLRRTGVTVLADNNLNDKYIYMICVVTGWWRHAGTSSRVFMYLNGTKGKSARHALFDPEKTLFTSGAENWFLLKTSGCVGTIGSIVIWHDHTGDKPSWFLKEVLVKDVQTDEIWHCVFDDWLSIDRGFGTLTAEVPAIEDHEFISRRFYQFMQASTRNFRDGHLWISIFFKPAKSKFTRVQRLTCALCVLITTMLTNIMYHGIPTTDPEDQIDYGDFHLSLVDFVIGIQSALLVFPINIIIIVLFTIVERRPDIVLKHEDEDEVDEKNYEKQAKEKEIIAKQENKKCRDYRLPWCYIYLAYFVAIGTSVVCSYFVMLYGLKYGYNKSISWVISFFTSFLENAFILQPLKVFGVAILLTMLFKQTVKYDVATKKVIEEEVKTFEQKGRRDSIFVHKLFAPPMSERLLENIRKKVLVDQKTWDILMEIILYFTFVIIVLLVVLGHSDVTLSYRVTRSVEDIFIHTSGDTSQKFYMVTDADSMWQYLNDTFLENIMFANTASHLVGRVRLRQVRLRRGVPCVTLTEINPRLNFSILDLDQRVNNTRKCYGIFRYDFDDRGIYDNDWQPINFSLDGASSLIWTYQSKFKLGQLPIRAKMETYPGGGYVVELPRNPFEGQKVIEEVRKTKWIDRRTRMVFVEFTLFNPNVQLFTVVVLMFEYSNTGFVFPYHQMYTANFYHYQNEFETFVAVCEALFVIYLLTFTYMEIKRFRSMKTREYFKDTWSYVEIAILGLSYVTIGLFINRLILCNNLMDVFEDEDYEKFVGFYTAAFFDALLTYVFGLLVLLTIIKFFKLLRFNARLSMLSETLRSGRGKLTAFSIGLLGFVMAFSIFAVLCFGNILEGYKNYHSTLVTLFLFILGESDYYGLYEADSVLGPVFFFLFALTFQFVLVQYFITLLMESFHATRVKIASVETEVHMVQYLLKRFRLLIMTDHQPKRQRIYRVF